MTEEKSQTSGLGVRGAGSINFVVFLIPHSPPALVQEIWSGNAELTVENERLRKEVARLQAKLQVVFIAFGVFSCFHAPPRPHVSPHV